MFTENCTHDEIPQYAGPVSIEISKDGLMLSKLEFAAEKGLDYAKYDLSVAQEFTEQHIYGTADAEISRAENENAHLRKGSYPIALRFDKSSAKQTFEIK